jgi:flagellar biosynthesis GTPase FlhF
MIKLEDYVKTISGEGNEPTEEQTKLAKALFELHEKDVQGLKVNSAALKEEKEKIKAERQADQEKFATAEKQYQEELRKAQEQISANSPEEVKKYYETQLATVDTSYKSQLAAKEKENAALNELVKSYEQKDILRSQQIEFDKAIRKTNADPATYDTIQMMVLGERGDRFAQHDTADGKMFWTTDGSGKSISNVIDEVLNTPVGKRMCNAVSSGSGAEGGSVGYTGTKANPFKPETLNITEQTRLYRENPELYKQLKAQANA